MHVPFTFLCCSCATLTLRECGFNRLVPLVDLNNRILVRSNVTTGLSWDEMRLSLRQIVQVVFPPSSPVPEKGNV